MTRLNPSYPKNPKPYLAITIGLLSAILFSGCGFQQERLYSKDEAERKFIRICEDEFKWQVNTRLIGTSLWIYLPQRNDIFTFKTSAFPQASQCSVNYVKGEFSEGRFYFEYQASPLMKTEEDKGYTYSLSEKINRDFYRLLNAIYRVYFNAENQPEFYVMIMSDITNGVEISYVIYGEDLKKIFNNAIAQEEYYKRIVQDTKGGLKIINDETGRHLSYQEIIFTDFLTKQIAQRIRYAFFRANSDVCAAPEEKILEIISYCMRTYAFDDFLMVNLKNLSSGVEVVRSRSALEASN